MSIFAILAPGQTIEGSTRNTDAHVVALPSSQSAAQQPPVVDPLDQRILDYVGERVGYAVRNWTMVNELAKSMKPSSEADRRRIVKALLQRLKALLHSKVIRRAGRHHVYLHVHGQPAPLSPFARNIPRRRRRARRRQVSPNRGTSTATAHIPTVTAAQPSHPSQLSNSAALQGIHTDSLATTANNDLPKSKSAQAVKAEGVIPFVTQSGKLDATGLAAKIKRRIASLKAGSRLARHRWSTRKIWTGYVNGVRCWRGRRVLLPDGVGAEVMVARRGKVLVFADRRASILASRFRAVTAEQLVVCKLPEAVLLGARKLGKKERPSERKTAACRRNGCCPCRPGSRPRGRPRTTLLATVQLS